MVNPRDIAGNAEEEDISKENKQPTKQTKQPSWPAPQPANIYWYLIRFWFVRRTNNGLDIWI